MRVAITGSNGYIGSNLAQFLLSRGIDVFGHSRSNSPKIGGYSRWHVGSLLDVEVAGALVREADVVVHLAAKLGSGTADAFKSSNAETTGVLAKACIDQGSCRLILASTIEVYDDLRGQIIDERHPIRRGASLYADSKIEAEAVVANLARRCGLIAASLRIGMTYSADSPFWTKRLFDLSERGQFDIINNGTGAIFPIHIEDLCEAISATFVGQVSGAYNIVRDEELTWRDWQRAYENHFGRPVGRSRSSVSVRIAESIKKPSTLLKGSRHLKVMTRKGFISAKRAENELGWVPKRSFLNEIDNILASLRHK